MSDQPYLIETRTVIDRKYNPEYGDDRICECGHPYYRHFDPYEGQAPVGCKYCQCSDFVEGGPGQINVGREEFFLAVLRGQDLSGYHIQFCRNEQFDQTHWIEMPSLIDLELNPDKYSYMMLACNGIRVNLVQYDRDDTKSVFVRTYEPATLGSNPLDKLFSILDPFLSDMIWLHPRLYPTWLVDAYNLGPNGDPYAGNIQPVIDYVMDAIPDDKRCRQIGAIMAIIDVERLPYVYGIALLTISYSIRELFRPQWMRFRDRFMAESIRSGTYDELDWNGLGPDGDAELGDPRFTRMILASTE